jgi:hypothetical protein
MSAPSTPPTLLTAVAEHLNTPAQPSTLVRHHGTQVWLLPHAQAIVRIMAATHTDAAQRALALTRWLHEQGLPVTEPLVDTLFREPEQIATVWRYYPHPAARRTTRLYQEGAAKIRLPRMPGPAVEAILINIFGGIVRCDRVAGGVIEAIKDPEIAQKVSDVPIIVRLQGTNAEEGKEIIDNSDLNVISAVLLEDAAKEVTKLLA